MTMEKTLTHEGPLGRKLTVHIDADTMQQARAKRLRDIGSNAQLPGFRKGKIPARVLERQYGKRAGMESAEEVVQRSLAAALTEEKLHLVGTPKVNIIDSQEQGGLSYCASFDVFPKVQLAPPKELGLQRPNCEISEQDMDDAIKGLRDRYPDETLVERQAKMGDLVDCSITLLEADGSSSKPRQQKVKLDERLDKTVLEFLCDKKAGDSGETQLADPGKEGGKIPLQITVLGVYELSLPELDEEFCKKLGVADLDTLRAEVSKTLASEAKHLQSKVFWNRVCAAFSKQHADMDLPPTLLQQETERRQQAGLEKDLASKTAADAIREHLLIEMYVSEHKLEPSPQEVRRLVERAASGHQSPKAYVDWHYADSSRLHNYRWAALQDRVLTHMTQEADFAAQNLSYAELSQEASGTGAATA